VLRQWYHAGTGRLSDIAVAGFCENLFCRSRKIRVGGIKGREKLKISWHASPPSRDRASHRGLSRLFSGFCIVDRVRIPYIILVHYVVATGTLPSLAHSASIVHRAACTRKIMPSLENVDVPMLPEEIEQEQATAAAVAAAVTADEVNHRATKRKITPVSERQKAPVAKKKKNAGQMTLGGFFGKPSTTLTPMATATTANKKKRPAKKTATAKAPAATASVKAVTTKEEPVNPKPSSQKDKKELEKSRKAALLSIVVGRLTCKPPQQEQRLNVQLLAKFDTTDDNNDNDDIAATETNSGTALTADKDAAADASEKESTPVPNDHSETPTIGNDTAFGDDEAQVMPGTTAPEESMLDNALDPPPTSDSVQESSVTAKDDSVVLEEDIITKPAAVNVDESAPDDKSQTLASVEHDNDNNSGEEMKQDCNDAEPKTANSPKKESVVSLLTSKTVREKSALVSKSVVVTAKRTTTKRTASKASKKPAAQRTATKKAATKASKTDAATTESKEVVAESNAVECETVSNRGEDVAVTSDETALPKGSNADAVADLTTKSTAKKVIELEPAPVESLSDETKGMLEKHESMRQKYRGRAKELLGLCREGLAEENTSNLVPETAKVPLDVSLSTGEFPDFAVKNLAALVEGSRLPLSALVKAVHESLNKMYETDSFTAESTSAKIKLLATRIKYIKSPSIVIGESSSQTSAATDLFEDGNDDFMWRWEVATLDFLPDEYVADVKKARSAKKKASSRVNALSRLIAALDDADRLALGQKTSEAKLDKAVAKISQEEEKALKFEREDEKARLAAEIKKNKEEAKLIEQKKKELELQEKAKEKELAAEEKRKEKERKKEEATNAREEIKQKKNMELDEKKKKEQSVQEAKNVALRNQKNCMQSFFSTRKPAKKQAPKPEKVEAKVEPKKEVQLALPASKGKFDIQAFRAGIDSSEIDAPFAALSARAINSRRRRTKKVAVSVFVTVMPDNPFETQPFAERQDIMVQNQYKFLRFHEDCRPPYHGTWSKSSSIVKGNNPFGKDTEHLDYDYDSEAEWEEGDEETGEDLENDMGDDDEEKDEEEGDDDDGWLAADDEIEDELELDEETKMLRKKKHARNKDSDQKRAELTVCAIAPKDGMALTEKFFRGADQSVSNLVEGLDIQEGCKLLDDLAATELNNFDLYLDAFPPELIEEDAGLDPSRPSSGQEMTEDDMKTFVRFVHLSTLGSKDKVVDELRSVHESITSSRAQAVRVLDSIADKKKLPTNEVYWEVKKDVLENLGLEELVAKTADVALGANDAKTEAMKKIATFVHHCTISSKEKVVDELRNTLESVTTSRAEAMRVLESIAEKKKDPVSGVYWEVKKDARDELGLQNLPNSPPPPPPGQPAKESIPAAALASNVQKEIQKNEKQLKKSSTKKRKTPLEETKSSVKKPRVSSEETKSSVNKRTASTEETPKENPTEPKKKDEPQPAGSVKLLAAFLKMP